MSLEPVCHAVDHDDRIVEAAEAAEGRNENTDTTDSMQINRIDKNE